MISSGTACALFVFLCALVLSKFLERKFFYRRLCVVTQLYRANSIGNWMSGRSSRDISVFLSNSNLMLEAELY